jgi:hypothetical protein
LPVGANAAKNDVAATVTGRSARPTSDLRLAVAMALPILAGLALQLTYNRATTDSQRLQNRDHSCSMLTGR